MQNIEYVLLLMYNHEILILGTLALATAIVLSHLASNFYLVFT